jgi:hypothetical protein
MTNEKLVLATRLLEKQSDKQTIKSSTRMKKFMEAKKILTAFAGKLKNLNSYL